MMWLVPIVSADGVNVWLCSASALAALVSVFRFAAVTLALAPFSLFSSAAVLFTATPANCNVPDRFVVPLKVLLAEMVCTVPVVR